MKSPERPTVGTAIRSALLGQVVTRPAAYTHTRYLEAKRTVDDRALHRPTLARLRESLASVAKPVRVVEAGCGTGSMLRRFLDRDVLPIPVNYREHDLRAKAVDAARRVDSGVARGDDAAPADTESAGYDLLVGCAFLDIVDLDRAIEPLLGLVPGGLAYFPITVDGETFLRPSLAVDGDGRNGGDGEDTENGGAVSAMAAPTDRTERTLLDVYHGTMDAPDRPGGSRTGRKLFDALPDAGADVVACGGSDWLVTPPSPADEAYFLHHLVDGIIP